MADKKSKGAGTKKQRGKREKVFGHDVTVEGNNDATVEDGGDVVKRKGSRVGVNAGKGRKKSTTSAPKPAEEKPTDDLKLGPAIEKEVDAFMNNIMTLGVEGLRKQYLELKNYIPPNYKFDTFSANQTKNRYADVVCLEETRIKLTCENPGEGDYIHANWVKMEGHDRTYIATQGPLDETIIEFWRMCWEHDVFCIVMLCKTEEDGKARCTQYWPEKQGEYATYGKIFVNNKKKENEDKFLMYTIEILPEGCSNSKIVKLIQFAAWPDRGVPLSGKTILRLLRFITAQDKLAKGNVVIHCSAGIGRTGTIILIDWVISKLFRGIPVSLVELFKTLRNQRASAIQTDGQYLFVFATIMDYIIAKIPTAKYKEMCDKFHSEVKALNLLQN